MLRFDAAVARFWAATHSKDGNPRPLMPWPRQEEQADATPEQVQAYLSQFVKPKKD